MLDEVLDVLCDLGCRSADALSVDDDRECQADDNDEPPIDAFWLEANWIELGGES